MTIVDTPGCDPSDREEMAERYVAGSLSPEEAEAFEAHLLECESCRQEVRLAEAIREALLEDESGAEADDEEAESTAPAAAAAGGSDGAAVRGELPAWLRTAAALALAISLVLMAIVLIPSGDVDPELAELGRVVQAPVYLGTSIRAPEARPDSLFADAMDAYVAEDYAAAVDGLRATLAAGGDEPPVHFFLGASLLMLDRPEEAIDAFAAVEASGDSPYVDEARFYRAKALLSEGEAEEALEFLQGVVGSDSPVAGHAAALVDSVRAVMP